MTTTNWDVIKNSTNTPNVSFTCLATTNLHYDLFGELVEGLSPLPISDIPNDPVIGTYYRQYSELVAGPRPTSDCDRYKKDAFDVDENNDGGAADDRVANDGVVDDGVADDKVADNNDDQGEGNDQNSDADYTEEQEKPARLGKGSFLDETWFPTLVTSEKVFLDTLEDVNLGIVTFDTDKKLTQ